MFLIVISHKICDWLYPKLELGWNRLLDRLEK